MREVLYWDVEDDLKFIMYSDQPTKETIRFEGRIYPLIKIEPVGNILD